MLTILACLLFTCLVLIVIGEPLRFFIFKRLKLFSNLDPIEICMLNIYLGGLVLYVVAMLPFPFYNQLTIAFLSILCLGSTIFTHYRSLVKFLQRVKLGSSLKANRMQLFDYSIVFIMFLFIIVINFTALEDFVFGSVCDESLHSLMVTAILDNKHVPLTLEPYISEGVTYPQASHVIFAFAFYLLNLDVPKVVFYTSTLFKALSVPGAYFLGKKFGSGRAYSLGLSFIFTFISSWPLSIVWGGNPFLVGFPLFLICLGTLFSMLHFQGEHSFAEVIAVGLLFGYAGAIIISYLQTLITALFLILLYNGVTRKNSRAFTLLNFVIIFCASLLPVSPFLYRFFAFYSYPGHNIGLPSDFGGWKPQQFYLTQALQWTFENLSPHLPLRMLIIVFVVGLFVLLWKTRNYENLKVIAFSLVIFVAAALLSFISFFLSAEFGVISWGHQGIILSIPINIWMLSFYLKLGSFFNGWKPNWLPKFCFKSFSTVTLLTLTTLSLITIPFLYYRIFLDVGSLKGAYGMFAVTTQSDYDLMLWMRDSLTSDSVILTHPYEAGLFIPSISNHKIVFPFSGSSLSRRYQTLVSLLENNTLITTEYNAYQLLQDLGITHVFVGSKVVYWMFGHPKLDPRLFLGNPNFKLVKNFNNAYLFKLNYGNPNVVFLDDFEYSLWDRNLWRTFSVGHGFGNVSIENKSGYMSSQCLKITAEMTPTELEWSFAYCVSREIFVLNNSEVTLSFYLNATQGFSRKDTFAVLVSNIYHNQSLIVATTPNGVYENYANTVLLSEREGFFEFKGNESLSALWRQRFNSSLPNAFILEFVNWDLDGIKNVVYLDNIQVTSTLVSEPSEEAGYG